MVDKQSCLDFLDLLGIKYEIIEHKAVYTIEEAMAELPDRLEVKNLFIQDDKGRRKYLVIMPGLKKLDLKILAADLGEKKVRFCSPEKVENILGVKPGSVSIFCCLNASSAEIKIVFDEDLLLQKEVGFHPIVNTSTVFIDSKDIDKILDNLQQQNIYIKI